MTNEQVFLQMAARAAGVMQAYETDLTVHDKLLIDGAKPGDAFLWTPRECGTYCVVLMRDGKPNRNALMHYEACVSSGARCNWYAIDFTARRGGHVQARPDHATLVASVDAAARSRVETVAEMHL